jgi:membrane fusion protein (multidrug efflux system)
MTRSRLILALVALVALAGLGWAYLGAPAGEGDRGRGDRGQKPVLVTLTTVEMRPFVDVIKAVGSARANESIELTAKVSDTVERLNFSDGQKVPMGHLVAEMNLREQMADLKAAEASLKEQQSSLVRGQQLRDRGFVSKASIDALSAARDSAAARVAATRSRIADRSIRTPFAGVLGLRRVSVGALVKPGDVITTLDDISRIKVDFFIAETQLADIALGQKIRASAAAFPGEEFAGTIESIDTRIDTASRAVTVRAVFPNEQARLRPGMLMIVGVETRPRTSLSVAEQTLVPIEARQHVFVVDEENKAERREVTTGARLPGHVEILSGLRQGEKVVLEGTLKVRPGALITLGEAEERKEAGPSRQAGERRP